MVTGIKTNHKQQQRGTPTNYVHKTSIKNDLKQYLFLINMDCMGLMSLSLMRCSVLRLKFSFVKNCMSREH